MEKYIPILTMLAMGLFIAIWVLAVGWTFRPGAKKVHEHLSNMILNDEGDRS